MSDAFNVTASLDKTSYNKGDTMTVTISGGDTLTTTSVVQSGTLTLTLTAADGATSTITVPPVNVNVTTTTAEAVKITGVVDSSGRVWTIASNGLSATAIA